MFRKEAVENKKNKWHGEAILLSRTNYLLVIITCCLFIFLFVLFISLGTYTRRINVSGEITTYPRPINIYSGTQGFITKIFVSEGDYIKKGDPIFLIDVSKSSLNGIISINQKKDIELQLEKIKLIIIRMKKSKQSTNELLEKQIIQYEQALKKSSDILKKAEEGLLIMKKNMDNYYLYQKKGLITKDQLTNQISLYYQQQNNLLSLNSQHESNLMQIKNLESQIKIQSNEFDNRINQMELQQYELIKELNNTDFDNAVVIHSKSDGKIDSLSVTVGQMVTSGDSLLQIIPQKIVSYNLVLWVTNDAIPYLKIGDKVNIRYEAFPSSKFGQFSGTIELISTTPASIQEMSTYQGAPKNNINLPIPYYKIIVKPKKQFVFYKNKKLPLKNGMISNVTLFLENRYIYQWMLSPIYDMTHSAQGVIDE